MKQPKQKKLLRTALIFGIIALALWCFMLFFPMTIYYEGIFYPRLNKLDDVVTLNIAERDGAVVCSLFNGMLHSQNPLSAALFTLILGSSTAAVLCNFIGMLERNSKKTLVAAILYFPTLNIISSALCFISFATQEDQAPKTIFFPGSSHKGTEALREVSS